MLQAQAGGADARPFITHHNTLDLPLYLRIATGLHLKRLVVGGALSRFTNSVASFATKASSTRHNPEFTSVEVYQAYADFIDMMDMTETMIASVCERMRWNSHHLSRHGHRSDPPWRRATMHELVEDATGLDFQRFGSRG